MSKTLELVREMEELREKRDNLCGMLDEIPRENQQIFTRDGVVTTEEMRGLILDEIALIDKTLSIITKMPILNL